MQYVIAYLSEHCIICHRGHCFKSPIRFDIISVLTFHSFAKKPAFCKQPLSYHHIRLHTYIYIYVYIYI